MSNRNDKDELSSDDEGPEASSLIGRRVLSREKAEYVPDERPNALERISRALTEKAEYVETNEEKSRRNSEGPSLLSTNQHSWLLFLTLTDESEEACAKFLKNGGLAHFVTCHDEAPNDEYGLALMLATLSNVSEHVHLRFAIMDDVIVAMFFYFLDAAFNISENAASILCNLAMDGPDAWTVKSLSRESVLAKVEAAIEGWNPDVRSNFRYTSLKPLLNLAQVQGAPACQKYALWVLNNLLDISINGRRYQNLLKAEGGGSILKGVVENPDCPKDIKARAEDLLQKIL